MYNKKAISPLIATVLLIGFTIMLTTVVIFWGRGLLKNLQEETELEANSKLICAQSVEMKVKSFCYPNDQGQIKLALENLKDQEITGFNIRIKGDKSEQTAHEPPKTFLKSLQISTFSIPHSETIIGQIEEIDIIPKITIKNKIFFCTERKISLSGISSCTESQTP